MITLIAAVDDALGIGKNGTLPWHVPEDLRRFKAETLGKAVIMGRTTHESIGKVLPGRFNIVVSRTKECSQDDAIATVSSLEDAIALAKQKGFECCIIGGSSIYKEALEKDLVHRLLLTHIPGVYECDRFLDLPRTNKWVVTKTDHFESQVGLIRISEYKPALLEDKKASGDFKIRDKAPADTVLTIGGDNHISLESTGNGEKIEMVKITPDGNFYVKGKLVTNDMEVYEGFKAWLQLALGATYNKKEAYDEPTL